MVKSAFSASLLLLVLTARVSLAGFALTVDPADLNFNGAGNYTIDLQIVYSDGASPGVDLNTISGYTVRFGSPLNANAGVLPSGVTIDSATEGLNVSNTAFGGLFDFNALTNSVAASGPINVVVPGVTTTLFSLQATLGNDPFYTIGVDLDNAQRGGFTTATQIVGEFFNPNSSTTDFTFTLTNVSAVPEPTSILTAASLGLGGMFYRRKRRPSKA